MAAVGFSVEAVAAMRAASASAEPDAGLPIHPDNVAAVRLFLALQTQWMTVSLSTMSKAELRRTGLIYAAVEPTARMAGLALDEDVFARLRVLEAEALTAWNETRR